MSLNAWLLAVILKWTPLWYPPGANPETPVQYRSRLETIARAVALEATKANSWPGGPRSLAVATLVIWHGETKFDVAVHRGEPGRWGSDKGRAKCLGQVHMNGMVQKPEWELLGGVDLAATRRCARATMRILAANARYCKVRPGRISEVSMARTFAAYATGRGCKAGPQSRARASRWASIMRL